MKIICTNSDESHRITFSFNIWLHFIVPAVLLAGIMGIFVATQTNKGDNHDASKALFNRQQNGVQSDAAVLTIDQDAVSNDEKYKIDINILARRLGVLEAETLRMNAFGTRIVKMAKLDPAEFAFDVAPPLGGLGSKQNQFESSEEEGYGIAADDLMNSINRLEKQLIDQRNRLEGMLQVLNGRILDKEVLPSSMPIEKGYISSKYGFRRDPFTGRKRLHKGIDFAAHKGVPVKAVASGVIQFAGRKGSYGNVVEVDHGEGLVSRYAHLSVIGVKLDQVVKKGDTIASVGSTGRSTGPHLHLEVLKNGVQQNPAQYF